MVGQSVMGAIVTCFFEEGSLSSWGSLLGEGSTGLRTLILLLSQRICYLNCSNLMEGLLF